MLFLILPACENRSFQYLRKIKKVQAYAWTFLHLSAERTLPSSNLKPLNELETSGLEKAISPHKIEQANNGTPAEILSRDLTAINDFLFYVEAEPFVASEKPENFKRVPFKKIKAA